MYKREHDVHFRFIFLSCVSFKEKRKKKKEKGKGRNRIGIFQYREQNRFPSLFVATWRSFPDPRSFPRFLSTLKRGLQKRLFMTCDPTPWNTITL